MTPDIEDEFETDENGNDLCVGCLSEVVDMAGTRCAACQEEYDELIGTPTDSADTTEAQS
jgi:hypothetical protein